MKVLVTGGTGLIGIHTVNELLAQGHAVKVMVRDVGKLAVCLEPFGHSLEAVEVAKGDITDERAVAEALAGCNAVIHCAGIFSNKLGDAARLRKTNVTGTEIVLGSAVAAGLDPVVHVSSYLALFPPISNLHRADDPVTQPRSMYARTKADAERIARSLQDAGAPVITVYPASVQGPDDPTYGIGSQLIEQAIRQGKYLVVNGAGRSYTDVRDLAQQLVKCLRPGLAPKRYMAAGYYLEDEALVKLVAGVSGREIKPQRMPGWLLRLMGSAGDLIGRLSGRQFQLTREAAEVLTLSVPCDDGPAIDELDLQLVGAKQSFFDLIQWMVDSGRLDGKRIKPRLPDGEDASDE